MMPLHHAIAGLLAPLEHLYTEAGLRLPQVAPLGDREVPEPYRKLLVHDRDMTTTLERFWGSRLHLHVLGRQLDGSTLTRQVVLMTDSGMTPVEFGAIRIETAGFGAEARDEILDGRRPLGEIIDRHSIECVCRPNAFFTLESDTIIEQALTMNGRHPLFGRHNRLLHPEGRLLAEVVEILPPMTRRSDTEPTP